MTTKDQYLALQREAEAKLPGSHLPWMRDFRRAALGRFDTLGMPAKRWEAWRYSDVKAFSAQALPPAHRNGDGPRLSERLQELGAFAKGPRLVFLDGAASAEHSSLDGLPEGLRVRGLAAALEKESQRVQPLLGQLALYEDNPFTALNGAFFTDGACIEVAAGLEVEPTLLIVHAASARTPAMTTLRSLIHLEDGAKLKVIELSLTLGEEQVLQNSVTEITVGRGARLDRVALSEEGPEALNLSDVKVHQMGSSHVANHGLVLGTRASRSELGFTLAEAEATCRFDGLFPLDGEQNADHVTVVDHAAPHCISDELYKGVLGGKSQGGFTGRIIVREGAQKTDAYQNNRNLLVSDDSLIATRPQLEIYADDVKCSHGATTGQIDEQMLFYLRSRGIPQNEAATLLTHAFAGEIVDRIEDEALAEHVRERLMSRIGRPDEQLAASAEGAA